MSATTSPISATDPGEQSAPSTGFALDRSALIAVAAALVSFTQSMRGATRSYTYDESVTVGFFVDADPLAGFTSQRVANNHPLFSVLEQVIWNLGGQSEAAMRALPALFTAATVLAIVQWTARKWGVVASLAGSAVLLTNPLFIKYGQEARGYSLLVLAAAVSTLCLIELEQEHRPPTRWLEVAYVLAAAAGLATHLYMLPVLAGHGAYILARGALTLRWAKIWGVVALGGSLAYMGAFPERRSGQFDPAFPGEAVHDVLGGHLVAMIVLGTICAAGLVVHRQHFTLFAAPMLFVLAIWTVVQPRDLYPRFLVWAVPAIAVAAAWSVARSRLALLPVLVAAALTWPSAAPTDSGIRDAAQVLTSYQQDGESACAVGAEALWAYTRTIPSFHADRDCEIVARVGSWEPTGLDRAQSELPIVTTYGRVEILSSD